MTTSAWCNTNNASSGEVGLLIRKSENALAEIVKWNDPILIVNFNGNQKTTIIIQFSPDASGIKTHGDYVLIRNKWRIHFHNSNNTSKPKSQHKTK